MGNASRALLSRAHFYNAILSEQKRKCSAAATPDTPSWPSMDWMIERNQPTKIFLGSPPNDVHQYCTRWLLCSGISLTGIKALQGRGRSAGRPNSVPRSKGKNIVPRTEVSNAIYEAIASRIPVAETRAMNAPCIEEILKQCFDANRVKDRPEDLNVSFNEFDETPILPRHATREQQFIDKAGQLKVGLGP